MSYWYKIVWLSPLFPPALAHSLGDNVRRLLVLLLLLQLGQSFKYWEQLIVPILKCKPTHAYEKKEKYDVDGVFVDNYADENRKTVRARTHLSSANRKPSRFSSFSPITSPSSPSFHLRTTSSDQ